MTPTPRKRPETAEIPLLPFVSKAAWKKWLNGNYASSPGIWIHFAKKASGIASVTYAEALDVALCYGWIDSQKKGHDEKTFLQAALDANQPAAKFFATLTSQNRYAILFRIHGAKKAETRAARIAKFVAMLERHETLH